MPNVRDHPQGTTLYLSIYQPTTLLACQINNASIERGARVIVVDNITEGSISAVYSGSTAMIGSQPGWDDYGRIRAKQAYGSTLVVAENAIDFDNNQYITVIDQVELEAIYPRIINDPDDPEDVIFYKDYDIPYTDENFSMGSLICMGDHHAVFLENGQAQVYYTASGTVNVSGHSLSYLWSFGGADSPTSSTAQTPGFVTYDTPGHYVTKLTVTSSQGAVDVGYRYISVYDKPGQGNSPPIVDWTMGELSGSRDSGGYDLSMSIRQQVDAVQPNAIVVLFADEFYGTIDGSIGGKTNRENIKFVGYILEDSIQYDYQDGIVNFKVASITELMKRADGFSVSCESVVSPDTWFEIRDMSVQKAIYHYLKWHSTVNLLADIQVTADDLKVQYFDADRASLYDAIYNFVSTGLKGNVVADKGGKIWIELEPVGEVSPTSLVSTMNILKEDWIGTPEILERRAAETSFIELGGIAYSGAFTGTYSALISNAPSEVPLYRGSPKTEKGLILTNQSQLNRIAGNYLAMDNARFYEMGFEMNGNYSNLDIAPITVVRPFIAPEDTPRNVRIQGEKYLVKDVNWGYSPVEGVYQNSVGLSAIVAGSPGVRIQIPDVPDDGGFSVGGLRFPPIPESMFPANMSTVNSGTVAEIANQEIINNADFGYYAYSGLTELNTRGGVGFNGAAFVDFSYQIQFTVETPGLYLCTGMVLVTTTGGRASARITSSDVPSPGDCPDIGNPSCPEYVAETYYDGDDGAKSIGATASRLLYVSSAFTQLIFIGAYDENGTLLDISFGVYKISG